MGYQVIVEPDRAAVDSYQIIIAPDPLPGSSLGAVAIGQIQYQHGSGLYHLVRDGILARLTPAPRGEVKSVAYNVFQQLFADRADSIASMADDEEFVVIEPQLGLPWEALHDGRNFLGLRFRLLRGLQLGTGIVGLGGPRESERPRTAAVVINPEGDERIDTEEVRAAHEELRTRLLRKGIEVVTVGPKVTAIQVMESVMRADIIHYYGHVHTDPSSGSYYIRCTDADLQFADIARTARTGGGERPLELLFINGCAGAEVLYEVLRDIVAARREVRVAIGSVVSEIDPAEALAFQIPLYEALLDGQRLGDAVLTARRSAYKEGRLTGALCYACYGDPATVLVGPLPPDELVRSRYDETGWEVVRWSVYLARRLDLDGIYSAVLFLALLSVPDSGLAEALARQGADTRGLRERLQKEEIGETEKIAGRDGFEVQLSESVRQILGHAHEIATDEGEELVSARHISRAFAGCSSSTAFWLQRNDIDLSRLEEDLREVTGRREMLTQDASDILRLAAKAAAVMGHSVVTSHAMLLAFLLAPPIEAGEFVEAFLPFAQFIVLVSVGGHPVTLEKLHERVKEIDDSEITQQASPSVHKVLELARQAARDQGRELLTGDDLWRAFAEVDTSQVYQFVKKELGFSLSGPYPQVFDAAGYLRLERFDSEARAALDEIFKAASSSRSAIVSTAHLLLGLLEVRDSLLGMLVQAQGADVEAVRQALRVRALMVGRNAHSQRRLQWHVQCLSLRVIRMLNTADAVARSREGEQEILVGQEDLIRAFVRDGGGDTGALLQDKGVDLRELERQAEKLLSGGTGLVSDKAPLPAMPGVQLLLEPEMESLLPRPGLCAELTERLLSPAQVIRVVGPAGAGKSTLCTLLAGHLQTEEAPTRLRDAPIVRVTVSASTRPIQWLEEFYQQYGVRLHATGAIIVLDGLEILETDEASQAARAAGQLATALGVKTLILMRPALFEAVRAKEPEPVLGISKMDVSPMDEDETVEVLRRRASTIELRDGVSVGEDVIARVIDEAKRVKVQQLPGAACQLLECAAAMALAAKRKALGPEEIASALARLSSEQG